MTEPETSQEVVPAPRNQSETLAWLSKQTGTEVKEVDGQVVISFGKQIEERVNCLAPVSQVAQIDANFSPSPRVVTLNLESDAFEPNKGKFSLNKVGLSKLADLAQIEIVDQKMQYLGSQGIRAIVTARMRGPDGTWKLDSQTKTVRFDVLKREVERRLKASAKKYKKAAPTEDDVAKAYDEELVFVDEKALADTTPVLTPAGYRPMGDLRIGDLAVGSDGQPTPIAAVWPQGECDLYDVEFTDGSVVRCTDDHLWTVTCNSWQMKNRPVLHPRTGRGRRAGAPQGQWKRPREEWFQTVPLRTLRQSKGPFHAPLLSAPVLYTERPEPTQDPWLIGALIGDGCLTQKSQIQFACAEDELVERVEEALPEDAELVPQGRCQYRIRTREFARVHAVAEERVRGIAPTSLLKWTREMGLQGKGALEKRIPENLLYGSPSVRLAVLQGLADTDGSVGRVASVDLWTSSEGLAEDIQQLVRSLGGRSRTTPKETTHNRAYRIVFHIPGVVPFRLSRKARRYEDELATRTKERDWRTIKSITPAPRGTATCITVAAEDGLFVTDGMVLTHNCSTKAFLRCVRKLLSVKGTYSRAELQKPFLVITWSFTPDWNNPRVAEMMALQYREGAQELYGAEAPALPAHTETAPKDVDLLPAAGNHAAAALEAAEREADQVDAAEEEAGTAETDPLPGEEVAEKPESAEDPEAWDLDEEDIGAGAGGDPLPKPDAHFTPAKGPFAGKDVEVIVALPEGKLWLAKAVKALKAPEKREQALAWLEWGTNGDVTEETLDEFIESASA